MVSKLVQSIEQGTALDRIKDFYRRGEVKAPLSVEDEEYLEKIEWIRDLWLEHKAEAMVSNLVINKWPEISKRQAYNWIDDAKAIWALSQKFDYTYELAVQKMRIEKSFEMAITNEDPKMMKAALDANAQWLELARKDAERNRPEASMSITFLFHMDFSAWMSKEQFESDKQELEKLRELANKKYKYVEDAEFIDLNK